MLLSENMLLSAYLFISAIFGTVHSAPIIVGTECETDSDCPNKQYCYSVSNHCAPCKSDFCFNLNREDSFRICHKEYTDCGQCLEGYEEEILADGSHRGPCIQSPVSTSLPLSSTFKSESLDKPLLSSHFIFLGIGALISALCLLLYTHYKRQQRPVPEPRRLKPEDDDRQREQLLDIRPPPYNASAPPLHVPQILEESANPSENVYNFTPTHCDLQKEIVKKEEFAPMEMATVKTVPDQVIDPSLIHVKRKKEEKFQQAKPFKYPVESEDSSSSDEELFSEANIDSNEEAVSFQYHDENTQPSDWTPGTQSNKRLSSDLCTEEEPTKIRRLCNDSEEE